MIRRGGIERLGCLRRYRQANSQEKLRLICFPSAGSGASQYRRLSHALPDYIQTWVVQLPGREDRLGEPALKRMDEIVSHIIEDSSTLNDLPTAFFGHSMGAMVAYEVATAMRDKFARVLLSLIVSGHGAPHSPPAGNRCHHSAEDGAFIGDLSRLGGTPQALLEDRAMLDILLPAVRVDYEVMDHYVAEKQKPFAYPLIACAGDSDSEVSPSTLAAWGDYTAADFESCWFQGGHFYLNDQFELLAKKIREWTVPHLL